MPACLVELNKLIEEENLMTGKDAIQLSGMQDSLIEIISIQNLYFGSVTTFMVNNPKNFPPFNSPGVAKPSNIHSKTSGLVGGYIPVDPIFTRLDANRKPLGHHHNDDLALQESVQVKWTLWEILKRCDNEGDLYMDWPEDANPIIRFGFKEHKGPIGFNGIFQLDLGEEKKAGSFKITDIRVVTRNFDDPEKFLKLIPSRISEAFFKNHKEIIYVPYKIFYNKEKNAAMQPLKVFSVDGKPIIGDWDKDLESLPLNIGILDLETANKEFNTFFSCNVEGNHVLEQMKLIKAAKHLFLNLLYKDFIFQDEFNKLFLLGLNKNSKSLIKDIDQLFHQIAIKTSLLERAGIITPYEFLSNILTNHVHNCNNSKQGLSEYYNDPCQHGMAGRSPFYLDKTISGNSDRPMFHIVVAENSQLNYSIHYIYTVNETQKIKLYLIDGILESSFIHVSHWLDMDKWSPIIKKQIELNQKNLIADKTFDKYLLYLSQKYVMEAPVDVAATEVPTEVSKKISRESVINFVKDLHVDIPRKSIISLENNNLFSPDRKFPNIFLPNVTDEAILFNFNRRNIVVEEEHNYNDIFNGNYSFAREFSTANEERYNDAKNNQLKQEEDDLEFLSQIGRTNSNLSRIINNLR